MYLLGVGTYILQRGVDRLPTGSGFLSVIRGHDGVSLREVVKRSSEVHHCVLLSEWIRNVVCSITSCGDQHMAKAHETGTSMVGNKLHFTLATMINVMGVSNKWSIVCP